MERIDFMPGNDTSSAPQVLRIVADPNTVTLQGMLDILTGEVKRLQLENERLLKLQGEEPGHLMDLLTAAESERDQYKSDYLTAAELVATLYETVTGNTGEPKRGVVEDVEDVMAELDRYAKRFTNKTSREEIARLNIFEREGWYENRVEELESVIKSALSWNPGDGNIVFVILAGAFRETP